jgi:radical SAM protein with 4Fe4S-binding SPASM domain
MSLDWQKIKKQFPIWKIVRLETHSYCSRDCEFCPRYDDRSGVRKDEKGNPVNIRMPTEKVYALMDRISGFDFRGYIGFHRLSEPLLDPRFIDFCRYARNKGMKILENTGGDVLKNNLELCREIDDVVNTLVIGLYDYKSENEKQRQMEHWQEVFKKTRVRFAAPQEHPKIRQNSKVYREARKDKTILTHPCFKTGNLLIRYDGNVSLCGQDDRCRFDLGNVFEKSLREIWWSEKHIRIVKNLQLPMARQKYELCSTCYMRSKPDIPPVLRQKLLAKAVKKTPPPKYARYREPSFLIIGAQKCGTTSLYHNLTRHPNIQPAGRKEIHFFDQHYEKGLDWYRSFFPPVGLFKGMLTGEASPRYFFLPYVPRRVAQAFPNIKLILLLRNPVDRAYSQYYHNYRRRRVSESFETALALETAEPLNEEQLNTLLSDPVFNKKYRRTDYLARGIYIHQLNRWLDYFPLEQFLILKSEDFFKNPGKTMDRVFTFLGLEPHAITFFNKKNSYDYPPMNSAVRPKLLEYFRPFNRQLYHLLGVDYNWEKTGK